MIYGAVRLWFIVALCSGQLRSFIDINFFVYFLYFAYGIVALFFLFFCRINPESRKCRACFSAGPLTLCAYNLYLRNAIAIMAFYRTFLSQSAHSPRGMFSIHFSLFLSPSLLFSPPFSCAIIKAIRTFADRCDNPGALNFRGHSPVELK